MDSQRIAEALAEQILTHQETPKYLSYKTPQDRFFSLVNLIINQLPNIKAKMLERKSK